MSVNELKLRRNLLRLASQEPRGSKLQMAIARLLYADDFDPKEIGQVEDGALEHDADDEVVQENFTQQEHHELRQKVEDGILEDGQVDTEPADLPEGQQAKQASIAKLSSSERALFKDLVKLAYTDKKARGPILSMLREAGLISASSEDKRARFPEGPEGTRLFEEWLADQPQSVQDDWEANKEKYGDKFKN